MKVSLDQRLEKIAKTLPVLVERLRRREFQFYHPELVLPGVEPTVEDSIARIERDIGRVPYAVAAFWRRVGSVDLTGLHDEWYGCEYPDGLVVLPASQAVAELDEFLDDRESRLAHEFPYLIPIAPDLYHKEDVSGGMWYNISCPALDDNPVVNDEFHELPFVDYLELALSWGGFPGLFRCPLHNWPINELIAN